MSSDLSNLNSSYNQGPSLSPPSSDAGIPVAPGTKGTTSAANKALTTQSLQDTLSKAETLQAGTVSKPLTNDLGSTVYTNSGGDPAPPAGLKGQSAAVLSNNLSTAQSSEGNPYFAPNPIAILSSAMYKFFGAMEKAALGSAKAVNAGMLGAADQSKSIAAAQIAAGKEQANIAIAQAIGGAFQAAAGMFSLGLMGKGLKQGLNEGADAIKAAEAEVKVVTKETEGLSKTFNATKAEHEAQTKILKSLQDEKKSASASTGKLSSTKAKELDAKIAQQEKVVKNSGKELDRSHKDLLKSQDKWQAAKGELSQAKSQQFQQLTQMGQWSQAISSTVQGIGQGFTGYLQSQAQIAQAEEEAKVTVGQTELQNINKAMDAASQSFQSSLDTMNGMRQSLDKAVDSVNQANNMRG